MNVQAPIELDVSEKVHTQDCIDKDEKEQKAAHVNEGWHSRQEGHDRGPKRMVTRDEEEKPHYPQWLNDSHLRTQLEGAQLGYYDTCPRAENDRKIHQIPVVFDVTEAVTNKVDHLLRRKDYC